MLGGVGVGPRQEEDVVGVLGLGRPDLLTVDDPLVSVQLRPGLERRQVGSCVRLAEALAPGDLAPQDARDELFLLVLSAPLQERGPDKGVSEEVGAQWRSGACELLVEDHLLQERETLPSVLHRPAGADVASAVKLGRPLLVEGGTLLLGHREAGLTPAVGQVLVQPSLDLNAKFLCLGGVRQVHRWHAIPTFRGGRIEALPGGQPRTIGVSADNIAAGPRGGTAVAAGSAVLLGRPGEQMEMIRRTLAANRTTTRASPERRGGEAMSRDEPPSSDAGACLTPCSG